ncbi:lipopolysaccharide biosynthesis protein [Planobispora longispora]|uniref:Polysaccharide biosynthesis protein n=1 Tax=Planobispora longispora TaxID=28887 RepID=A0A8J3W663_9ACTN|nr:polysaccharide biosynthesis C-terminal domain-containing protein [Planobispora longispora]GIH77223.1 hypothetical protein Plo01_36520 [Planobispora longispora]
MAALNTPVPRVPGGLARHGLAGLAGAGISAAVQFLTVVLLTRSTGQETAGTFFTATALCLMTAGVLRMDAGNGLIHFLARTRRTDSGPTASQDDSGPASSQDDSGPTTSQECSGPAASRGGPGAAASYLRAALVPVLALSVTAAVTVMIITVVAAGGVVPSREVIPAGAPGAVLVAALALPVIVCSDVLVAATRGLGTMRLTALLDGVLRPLGQLILLALVLPALLGDPGIPALGTAPGASSDLGTAPGASSGLGVSDPHGGPARPDVPGLAVLLAAWALPYLPVVLLAALWLRRRLPRAPRARGAARELWRHTWPRSAAAAVQAVFQRFDIVIVAALAGAAEAAVYTAATRFKAVGQLAGQGLAQAAQPRLVRALAEGDLLRARRIYQTTTAWLVLLTWPVWLAYAALAPWLLGLFGDGGSGGDGYASGVPVALVLAATMMIATACGMADVALTAAGHTRASLANLLAALAVTAALGVALIPSLGALGAALGWSAGVLVKNLLPLWRLHRRYGLRPFGRHTLPACAPWRRPDAAPALAFRRS